MKPSPAPVLYWPNSSHASYKRQRMKEIGIAIGLSLIVTLVSAWTADARPRHHRHHHRHHHARVHHHHHRHHALDANGNVAGLVTVDTAAGISIKVASTIADRMQGFIRDVIARGYHPKQIHCYSWAKSHVRNSLHHRGEACDFDQRGWGKTAAAMYHVADLARKWGLRDGCTFRDCGHIDSGRGFARAPWPRIVETVGARGL